jgi:uncharacterized protein (TIGR04255 family)
VVIQVRIAAVLSLEDSIAKIQEKLRRSGFPKFLKSTINEVRLDLPQAQIKTTTMDRFEFQARDGQSGIVLTANTLGFHTSKYEHFEDFLERFERAVELINSVLDIAFAERVGLRYIDLVRVQEGETIDQYITKDILGPTPGKLGMLDSLSQFQMGGRTDVGVLLFRLWQFNNGSFLPPDLVPNTLTHNVRLEQNEKVSIVDMDHYLEDQLDFDAAKITRAAWVLHDNLDRTFRAVVTDYAIARWKNQSVEEQAK